MFGKKEGESCYMDTDCETGYVCMEGYGGKMECREPQPGVAKFGKNKWSYIYSENLLNPYLQKHALNPSFNGIVPIARQNGNNYLSYKMFVLMLMSHGMFKRKYAMHFYLTFHASFSLAVSARLLAFHLQSRWEPNFVCKILVNIYAELPRP